MSITPAEMAALDSMADAVASPRPIIPLLTDRLIELRIDPEGYKESISAERDFVDYIAALAIQDLHRAGVLTRGPEVVAVAQQFWPLAPSHDII